MSGEILDIALRAAESECNAKDERIAQLEMALRKHTHPGDHPDVDALVWLSSDGGSEHE